MLLNPSSLKLSIPILEKGDRSEKRTTVPNLGDFSEVRDGLVGN